MEGWQAGHQLRTWVSLPGKGTGLWNLSVHMYRNSTGPSYRNILYICLLHWGSSKEAQHYSTLPSNLSWQRPTGWILSTESRCISGSSTESDSRKFQETSGVIWDMQFILLIFSYLSLQWAVPFPQFALAEAEFVHSRCVPSSAPQFCFHILLKDGSPNLSCSTREDFHSLVPEQIEKSSHSSRDKHR